MDSSTKKSSSLQAKEKHYSQQRQDMQVSSIIILCTIMQFTNFVYADRQSIATCLARRIVATHDSLKEAIAKFNRMPADTYEGCLYHLL